MKAGARFELLYSGKRDGWQLSDFHRVCDGKAPTMVLFKSSKGSRFGGYTTVPWAGPLNWYGVSSNWKEDRESFIFSVDERQLVFKPNDYSKAVYHWSTYGPNFGAEDLGFCTTPMNAPDAGRCYISSSFCYHNLPCDSEGNHVLTGDGKDNSKGYETFTCTDLEVYKVIQ